MKIIEYKITDFIPIVGAFLFIKRTADSEIKPIHNQFSLIQFSGEQMVTFYGYHCVFLLILSVWGSRL